MSRSDDTLRRLSHERLHAVAGRTPAPARVPSGAGDDDPPRASTPVPGPATGAPADDVRTSSGWSTGAPVTDAGRDEGGGADPVLQTAGSSGAARGRHRSTSSPPGPPAAGTTTAGRARADDPLPAAVPALRTEPVPDRPPVGSASDDVRDVVERMRREALAEAAAQYGERHGHPLEHPGMDTAPAARRWFLTVHHAVVAGAAVVLLTAGVLVRATAGVPPVVEPPGGPVSEVAGPVTGAAADAPAAVVLPGGPAAAAPAAGTTGDHGPSGGVPAGATTTTGTGTSAPGSDAVVVVHVVGQVHVPGVVQLPAGSRVEDAIRAAGGAGPGADLAAVNLARELADGEQLVVPAPGQPVVAAPGPGTGAASAGDGPGVVDLNAADLTELDALPGIGPVLAQRILQWRADNGPFRDVEELGEVSGIGDALLGRLRPLVAV